MTLKQERIRDLVQQFSDQHILVVGDLMLDRYIYGEVSRISPEAPVPVVQVLREENMPGGASNVAWNIQALGGQSTVSGFIGTDWAAKALEKLLMHGGVSVDGVVAVPSARTTVKTRIIAEHQQVVRVDWDDHPEFKETVMGAFCERVKDEVKRSSGVIIEDYGKGVIQQRVVDVILKTAKEAGVPTAFDPKDNHELQVSGVTVATPNRKEAYLSVGVKEVSPEEDPLKDERLLDVSRRLAKKWQPDLLLITLGAKGMLLVSQGRDVQNIPTRAQEVFDVSGAGDTVIATCLLALASGATHEEASELANYAAGIVVGKLGTAPCTKEELMAAFTEG